MYTKNSIETLDTSTSKTTITGDSSLPLRSALNDDASKNLYPITPSMPELVIWGTYQHYKGDFYKVLTVAKHSETHEDLVIYISLYEPREELGYASIRARPKTMFLEEVNKDGKTFPRFALVNPLS